MSNGSATVKSISGCLFTGNGGSFTRAGGAIAFTHASDNVCHPILDSNLYHFNNAVFSGGAVSGINVNSLMLNGSTFL